MARIVVGVDGSAGAAEALRWAWLEAELRGGSVTAVMAWSFLDQRHADPDAGFDPDYREDDAQAALDTAVERALGAEAMAAVRRCAIVGVASQALIETSADADLLVVGARGLGGFKTLLLGSVSLHCLHYAGCPVAVVRQGVETATGSKGRIIAGIDGSATGQRALRWALDEARLKNATLEVVHAWQMPYLGVYPYVGDAVDVGIVERAASEVVDEALAAVDTGDPPVPVERTVVNGSAARAIVEAAERADLVVVGARGLGGFGGMLLGSVSQQVARHAASPVIVVRSEERD